MKIKTFTLVFLILILTGGVAHSQITASWSGTAIDKVAFPDDDTGNSTGVKNGANLNGKDFSNPNSLTSDQVVTIYNVKKGQFISSGGNFGTQAVMSDHGYYFYITKDVNNNRYFIHSQATHSGADGGTGDYSDDTNGAYLGFSPYDGDPTPYEGGNNGPIFFVDRAKRPIENDHYPNAKEYSTFIITKIEGSDNHYRLQIYSSTPKISEGRGDYGTYVGCNDNGELVLTDNADDSEWMFVTKTDVENAFSTNVDVANGKTVDASVFLFDGAFLKNDIYGMDLQSNNKSNISKNVEFTTKWKFTPAADTPEGYTSTASIGIGSWTDVTNDGNGVNYNKLYGKYSNAQINGNGTLSQTITVNKSGWYRVSAQGKSASRRDYVLINAHLFAKVTPKYGGNSYTVDADNFENSIPANFENKTGLDINNAANSAIIVGEYFSQNENNYRKSVEIYIPAGSQLEVGVIAQISEVTKANPAQAFPSAIVNIDNFKLEYVSPALFFLNENATSLDYINNTFRDKVKDDKDANGNQVTTYDVVLNRTYTANQWQTLVLPINLTYNQFNSAFGDGNSNAYLATFDHVRDGILYFKAVDIPSDKSSVYLSAGKPYIFYPRKNANRNATQDVVDAIKREYGNDVAYAANVDAYTLIKSVTVKDNDIDLTAGNLAEPGPQSAVNDEVKTVGKYVFNGIYTAKSVPGHTYALSNNKIYYYPKSYQFWGFRCYISDTDDPAGSNAKPNVRGIGGLQDIVTSIGGINVYDRLHGDSEPIFNLNGQRVNSSSLPAGIYIKNGRKFVIK